jgi:hypothetical protein
VVIVGLAFERSYPLDHRPNQGLQLPLAYTQATEPRRRARLPVPEREVVWMVCGHSGSRCYR